MTQERWRADAVTSLLRISPVRWCSVQVHYGHSVETVDFEARRATFSAPDGHISAGYDLLVAADGRHSKCRCVAAQG